MKKKEKEPIVYLSMNLDSLEELNFCYWVEELMDQGFIYKIERARSYKLTDGIYNQYIKQLKTKSNNCQETILQPSSYMPDFEIYFTEKGYDKFVWEIGSHIKKTKLFISDLHHVLNGFVTVEVKPNYDQNSMERLFRNNQKFLYEKYLIFANLIKPQDLFEKTFTPIKALLTHKTKQKRKINWEIKTLKEYLNE